MPALPTLTHPLQPPPETKAILLRYPMQHGFMDSASPGQGKGSFGTVSTLISDLLKAVRKSRWARKRQRESCRWSEVLVFWMALHSRKVRAARKRHNKERLSPT